MAITKMYNFRLCKQFKQENRNNAGVLKQLANLRPHVSTYNTRNNEPWKIDTYRTTYGLEMLQNKLPRLLNTLHENNISLELITFKELRHFSLHTINP